MIWLFSAWSVATSELAAGSQLELADASCRRPWSLASSSADFSRPRVPLASKKRLQARAPPNPLRGVTAGDAGYIEGVIAHVDGPVILVGHSYGGTVITAAGNADNVAGLVYVAAFAPDEGEDLGGLQAQFPAPLLGPYITGAPLPDGGQDLSVASDGFHQVFCADLGAEEANFMAVSQRPVSGVAFVEKAPAPVPSWSASSARRRRTSASIGS